MLGNTSLNKSIERGPHGWFAARTPSYIGLLNYQSVKDWIGQYGSGKTRKNYLGYLNMIVGFSKLSPEELLRLGDQEVKRLVLRCAQWKLQEDKPDQARLIIAVAKSFLGANDRELKLKRGERVHVPAKKVLQEVIPSKYEVYRMADHADSLRDKAVILSLFQSGVRVSCLPNWNYGLVKDYLYPEVKVPVYIKVTSKMDTKMRGYGLPYYYTFLGAEAAKALRAYLDWRMENGWKPKDGDPIFVTQGTASVNQPLDYWNIRNIVKHAVRKTGLNPKNIWVHCLRKSFRKILYTSGLDTDVAETLMAHKLPGSRGNYFDYHDVDEIAKQYMKCGFSQDLPGRMNNLEERIHELEAENRDLKLKLSGFSDERVELKGRIERVEKLLSELKALQPR